MEILLLGVGLQGKAALYDLVRQPQVRRVIAADMNEAELIAYTNSLETDKVTPIHLDVSDEVLAERRANHPQADKKVWKAEGRPRAVSTALKVYAAHVSNASLGAVRQLNDDD